MKKWMLTLLVLGMAWTSFAVDKSQLDQKAQKLIAKFQRMQERPDKAIPADVLRRAQGIILLDRTKAGFVFAFQGGGGIAMVKDKKGRWSPISFMQANEGSLGFQVGGQQTFFVILLMTEDSAKSLIADATFELGGEARGTAGDVSAGAEGSVASTERSMMIYDDRKGLFGGAAVKGGAIAPDQDANLVYYGEPITQKEILLDGKVKPSETAIQFARKIKEIADSGR